jgi:transposase-like protein
MEEGRQKPKRLSYTAKFKHEVIRRAEEKGNSKTAAIFGVDESKRSIVAETQDSDQRV